MKMIRTGGPDMIKATIKVACLMIKMVCRLAITS